MSTARTFHGVASVNGIVYAFGGNQGSSGTTVEAFDPASQQWSPRASMSAAGVVAAAAIPSSSPLNGLIYVTGATGNQQIYDTFTDTWVIWSAMPTSRDEVAAGVIGSVLYAVGGMPHGGTPQNSVGTNESFSTSPGLSFAGTWQLQFTPALDLSSCGSGSSPAGRFSRLSMAHSRSLASAPAR